MMKASAMLPSLLASIVYLLMSSVVGSHEVDISPSHKGSKFLREAVKNLINYTTIEVQAGLDMNDIGSTVAGIAYQKLTEKLTQIYPRHCNDHERLNKPVTSGLTLLKPDDDGEPFRVYCNNDHYGGGWTRIQQRSSSAISFRRDWDTYKEGFGYLSSDGWLGLEKIHRLTKNGRAQLLVMVMDRNYKYYYAQYKRFMVGSEDTEYTLYIGNYSGDAGDSLSFSNYAKFSTYDEDNDGYSYTNCASSYRGGWWYKGSSCSSGKLNGDAYSSSSSNYYVKWPTISSYAARLVTMEVKIFD